MNINIYLQEQLLERIDRLAKETGRSRSALIREALEAWLSRRSASAWPALLREWEGDPTFAPFELGRNDPSRRAEDPFDDATPRGP
jgi:Arc/MetJ-type ribon-helix-helix transcriptional regulator